MKHACQVARVAALCLFGTLPLACNGVDPGAELHESVSQHLELEYSRTSGSVRSSLTFHFDTVLGTPVCYDANEAVVVPGTDALGMLEDAMYGDWESGILEYAVDLLREEGALAIEVRTENGVEQLMIPFPDDVEERFGPPPEEASHQFFFDLAGRNSDADVCRICATASGQRPEDPACTCSISTTYTAAPSCPPSGSCGHCFIAEPDYSADLCGLFEPFNDETPFGEILVGTTL